MALLLLDLKNLLKSFFVVLILLVMPHIALGAVAHDATSESHTGTTGSTNQSSFSWTHTPVGTPRGVLVFVYTISATKTVTGVTYGGVAMAEITGGAAIDSAGEPGRVDTYFLGTGIPTGAQTITVSRTNSATIMYATASTQTAAVNTEIYTPGIVLLQESGAYTVQSVTDGSTGVDSLRYAAGYYGGNNTLPAGTGTTLLNSIDFGSYTATMGRETTAGQGARNVGFTQGTSDDRAAVHLAVREIPATGSVSASPTSCTISSGASTCSIPFTWSISNATTPNLYNTTTANQYSTAASGTGVSYPITNGSNTVQARNSTTVLASTIVTASCTGGTVWNGSICAPTNTAPTLSISQPDGVSDTVIVGASYNITYSLADTEQIVTAAFYYDTNNSGLDGVAITGACATAAEGTNATCSWNTTGVTPGSYYVYGLTSDGIAPQVNAYSPGMITISAVPVTTIADGTNPGSTTLAPGGSTTDLDAFTLTTNTGSDTVTSATVTLSPAGAFNNIAQVDLTDNANLARCTAVTNPGSNTISFSTCTSNGGVSVTTSPTTYKIRITPKSHANMSVPPGSTYSVTGTITNWTGTNPHSGSDTGSATITIDNTSPENSASVTGGAGDARVTLNWTNPTDSDFHSTIILRRASSAVADTPTEGATYSAGDTIGTATVACVIASPGTTCEDTGLINGTTYHYKVFSRDNFANYAGGVVPTGSPFSPSPTTFAITSSAGANGSIIPLGVTNVAQGGSQTYTISPDSGYTVDTLTVDSTPVTATTTYTFLNVQTTHTIHATFSPVYTITANAGVGGSVTPAGTTTFTPGSSQIYTITPDSGYNIETLTVDSVSVATSTSYTFTNILANHTISATFSLIPSPPGSFSIVATSGTGGSVTPSGATTITQGASQTYTITPNSGYTIATLLIDGASTATSTSYTFTNVQASHTITATFSLLPSGVTTGGTSRPTTSTFKGYAFPFGTIQVVDKTLNDEKIITQKFTTEKDGSFSLSFSGIFQTLHSFGLIAKDKTGRTSQTKFFMIDTRSDDFSIKELLLPPTIDLVNGQVSRGTNALIIGYASPNHIVRAEVDGIITKELPVKDDGSYKFEISTGSLEFGQHRVQVRQIDPETKKESDPSLARTFIVSRLTVTQADLSGDGKIDIRDWSIFLSRWLSKDTALRGSIDLNNDGKVNIVDFSIFIKTIRKQ